MHRGDLKHRGELTTDNCGSAGACRFPTAGPYGPAGTSHPRGSPSRSLNGGSLTFAHPDLLLACGPRMERALLGFFPELRTPQLPATHVRAETGHHTLVRGYTFDISRTSMMSPTSPKHPHVAPVLTTSSTVACCRRSERNKEPQQTNHLLRPDASGCLITRGVPSYNHVSNLSGVYNTS